MRNALIATGVLMLAVMTQAGETTERTALPFGSLPTWENPWKKFSFGPDELITFEYGLSARWKYEFYSRPFFNQLEDPDGYLLQRYLFHAEASVTEYFSAFVEFQAGLEDGREGGPRPTDQNTVDVHQLYGDLKIPFTGDFRMKARVGRQEMFFGSQRLVSVREGPNLRLAFDAVRLIFEYQKANLQLFISRPVETDDGYFNSQWEKTRAFWGAYATTPLPFLPGAGVDVYYLGYNNERARFNRASGNEVRHSFGTRFFGEAGGFDWNYEAVLQTGYINDLPIFAWTLATETGYTFEDAWFSPRVFLKANMASGDSGRGSLGTFNALFPKASYFNDASLYGPYNLMDLQPGVELSLLPSLTMLLSCDIVARMSQADGLYGPSGNLLVRSSAGSSLFTGVAPNLQIQWRPNRNLEFAVNYVPFVPGDFVIQAGGGTEVLHYLSLLARVTF